MVAGRLDCRYAVPTFGDYFKRFQSAFSVGNLDRAESAGQRFKSALRLHCIFIPPSARFIDFRQVTRSTSPALKLLHRKMGFDRVVYTAATELLFNLSTCFCETSLAARNGFCACAWLVPQTASRCTHPYPANWRRFM
jgi:hypothetical protein